MASIVILAMKGRRSWRGRWCLHHSLLPRPGRAWTVRARMAANTVVGAFSAGGSKGGRAVYVPGEDAAVPGTECNQQAFD